VTTQPVLSGVLPIAPTTFDDDGGLDLPSQRRALDFVIDAGSDAICLLANFSEQFALSDAERDQLFDVAMEHIAGRVPVILTASHFSARVTADRCRRAEAGGASAIMVMPPYHGATIRMGDEPIRGYFETVAAATALPIIVQDSPVSGTPLSVDLLASLAETIPTIAYFKLETADATVKLRALLDAGGRGILGPFDGEEGVNLAPDLDAGATGTMPSAMIPDILGEVVRRHRGGERDAARALYEHWLPLILYENRLCGLRATKVLMHVGGIIESEATRSPLPPLTPSIRAGLIELALRLDPLILRWARG
jgi:4-hydroxy-tetrahydrodipicolinate synthase